MSAWDLMPRGRVGFSIGAHEYEENWKREKRRKKREEKIERHDLDVFPERQRHRRGPARDTWEDGFDE